MFARSASRVLAALMVATALSLPALAADPIPAKGYQAITKPSKEVTASFVRPGRVAEVLVEKNDPVKAHQLLARQDDTEEQAALAIDKLDSENDTEIKAEEAVAKQAAVDADRMVQSGAPPLEVDKAKLEVVIDEARIQIARINLEKAKLKYAQTKIAVEKLKLYSEIDGIVSEKFLEAGESADGGNMKVLHIVQLDPLRVEVPVPMSRASTIKVGDTVLVTSADEQNPPWLPRQGKVSIVPLVGDSASETILIRVEVPNSDKKIRAGENIFVKFEPSPAPQIGAADKP